MVEGRKDICETHIISRACRERFLPLDHPAVATLQQHDISLAGLSEIRDRYDIGRGDPNFHVVLFTLEGHGTLLTERAEERLEGGTLLILPAHTPHRYFRESKVWRILWFHLRVRKSWTSLEGRPYALRKSHFVGRLHAAVTGLLEETSHPEPADNRAAQLYAELVDNLLRREVHMHDRPGERRLYARLNRLWNEVESNLGGDWDVSTLSRKVHMSSGHFHRTVVALFGTTPMKMVTAIRMRWAETLLRNTDDPVAVIASRLGYSDPFAFSVAFKRHTGLSPRNFRTAEWEHGEGGIH